MKNKITFKNTTNEAKLISGRLLLLSVCIFVLLALLIARLFYLQVTKHEYYLNQSISNTTSRTPIVPNRGLIYDRNNVLMAENVTTSTLAVIPSKIKNFEQTIAKLRKIIPITKSELASYYRHRNQYHAYQEIPLATHLTKAEVAKFEVNQLSYPGAVIETQLTRYYPLGSSEAHVLGYVGRINAREVDHLTPSQRINYLGTNYYGKVGIENYFEPQLHGKTGFIISQKKADGQIVKVIKKTKPIDGDNLYLSIDSKLEKIAENALSTDPGSVVAIQPSTGQVLAMVSTPSFNPNLFVNGISNKEYQTLSTSKKKPLFNRAVRGLYPLGSTIKPFLALGALNDNVITPDYQIDDKGFFQIPGTKHKFHDWLLGGHGWIGVTNAIIVSCDTFFYNLANMLGINRIDNILAAYGFGQNTGIQMHEELPGLLPTPTWKKANFGTQWYPGNTVLTGIGQGFIQTTPLQLAAATATLANRGKRFQPTLVYAIQKPGQKEVIQQPIQLPSVIAQPDNWNIVINAMKQVVSKGTGWRFGRNPPYSIAAKTGTAQVASQTPGTEQSTLPWALRDQSLFIAFAPVDNPKIAIAVVAEHSENAPVVARKVIDYYLCHQLKECHVAQ